MFSHSLGFHPLPRRYLKSGEVARLKVENTSYSVLVSWAGAALEDHAPLEPSQIKLLNSNFASSDSTELLNLVPKVVDVSGLLLSDPLSFQNIAHVTFYGHVIHSKKLQSWTRVHPQALYLGKAAQAGLLAHEMNKYRTLTHQNIPWETLEHTRLTQCLQLLRISRDKTSSSSSSSQDFSSLSPRHLPTALVYWVEIVTVSGARFMTSLEPLWRPAAVLFRGLETAREKYSLSVAYSEASLSACIT